jgi:regulator of replication initiation timing
MTDEALRLAFDLACKGRDLAETKNRELEQTVGALCDELAKLRAENAELKLDNLQMKTRLRLVELMEQEAANRLGFQIPLRAVPDEAVH